MKRLRLTCCFALISALLLLNCEKSCSKKPATPATQIKEEAKNLITSFPELKLDGLNETQVKSLTKLLNEEICPCGCPKTFAACLNISGCKPGVLLAQWTIDQLKEGAPEHYLYKAISEEINAGFLAEAKKITTLDAHRKGNPNAPIVIVEFADFECPACKMAAREMKEFLSENKDDVQIYFMHFPLNVHPHAEAAALAAEAAGKQGKFWDMHDLLFGYQGPLTENIITDFAKTMFNTKQMAQFKKDLLDPALSQKVKAHKEYGQNELKLMGTPAFMWNGRPYNLSSSKDGYRLRLAMEKARAAITCQGTP
jgi:hypothetical protein